MRTNLLAVIAASLLPLCAGVPTFHLPGGLRLRKDEPCRQIRDEVAKWMSDNHIGKAS